MGNFLRIIILILGSIFTITVFSLLVKGKINERNSLLWLLGSIVVFVISLMPLKLNKIAEIIGVNYPPTLLFLFSTIILLFITLYHSVQISELNSQIRELTQYIALQKFLSKEQKGNIDDNKVKNS